MSTLREMAEAVAKQLDGETEFFLVVREKGESLAKGIVATNVGMRKPYDVVVEGTGAIIHGKEIVNG